MKSLLTLADVMPTGYHAARVADVKRGDKVVVIGDGAVGQCAVIAAKMRGASQIVLMSRHEDRQQMALASGATAVVAKRGEEGIAKVRQILGGGADAALECVGTEATIEQALGVIHNGGRVGFVGVPHYNNRPLDSTFAQNITVGGGSASVTTYNKQLLLKAVLDGDINPGGCRVNDGHTVAHMHLQQTVIELTAQLGQLYAVVSAFNFPTVFNRQCTGAVTCIASNLQDIGDVLFTLGIIGGHLLERIAKDSSIEGVDPRVDFSDS